MTEETRARPGPAPSAPCGTPNAWRRHQRNGEPIDQACREAWNTEMRRLYAERMKRRRAAAASA